MTVQEIHNWLGLISPLDDCGGEEKHGGGKKNRDKFWQTFWEVYNQKGAEHFKIVRDEYGFKIFTDEDTFFGVRCFDGKFNRVRRTASETWTREFADQVHIGPIFRNLMAQLEAEAC